MTDAVPLDELPRAFMSRYCPVSVVDFQLYRVGDDILRSFMAQFTLVKIETFEKNNFTTAFIPYNYGEEIKGHSPELRIQMC